MREISSCIQHYAWGSATAIPTLLRQSADGRPWAEAWFGAHPLAPSPVDGGGTLQDVIAADPAAQLGPIAEQAFEGRLPYLLKLIAPDQPLSLQVHPAREHAQAAFAAENSAGLPLDDPQRNYRDGNHKPEMLVALTEFTALCGFRAPRRAATLLEGLDTALTDRLHASLVKDPTADGMAAAFRHLLALDPATRGAQIAEVAAACEARLTAGASPSPRIDVIVGHLHRHYPGDPGVVAALLLNPVTLHPGEALYVPDGTLHAYLSGVGVEIMAASDNVLRAGLTCKRVDVEETLRCVSVTAAPPVRIAPERQTPATVAYYAPVDEFELSFTEIPAGEEETWHPLPGSGPRILLALEGTWEVRGPDGTATAIPAGSARFVGSDEGPLSVRGHGRLVQASTP